MRYHDEDWSLGEKEEYLQVQVLRSQNRGRGELAQGKRASSSKAQRPGHSGQSRIQEQQPSLQVRVGLGTLSGVLTPVWDSSRLFLETSCYTFYPLKESDFKM